MKRTGRPTIKELAEQAGVSKTAVSFAFNSPERISKETYARIMAIAQELGYVPDPVARGLARRKTQCIGILLPQSIASVFQNPYITELLRGVGEVCEKEKFSILVLSPLEGIFTHAVYNAVVDGVIILGAASASAVQQVCRQRGLAYVTVDAGFSGDCINIGIDEEEASYQLARILLDAGHRRLCVCTLQPLSETLESSGSSETIRHRRQGIQRALDECGAGGEVQYLEVGAACESALAAARSILSQDQRPTGIFCMADVHAYGFYGAARELGLAIPRELSVVTFDNLPQSQLLHPRPTAVDQPGFQKGWLAATELFKLLEADEAQSVVMDFQILKTGSVASPAL
ncbi:MAG: LacI family DNA-binding transcriptional regulator [Spirochaetaceae bacterium]|nr:LacI family DNA-binding transcriptional regulator [Spirochaetaceae bacterium]MBQ7367422.1 LacI family DNA-binding transcriptional regulator [Spirochaetaceae bacterium]MBQ8560829.1 LacI family DNA-binding transcriptional regulator [Spirochaetaceae bacterium]MBR2462717.1 LacI family DNA-binding transcriptional regulator [Spirochaetaceae bacterium]